MIRLSESVTSNIRDVRHFFGESNVLQQFWGNYRKLNRIDDFTDNLTKIDCPNPTLAASLINDCYGNKHIDSKLTFCTAKNDDYDHVIFPLKNITEHFVEDKKEIIFSPKSLEIDHIFTDKELDGLPATYLPCFGLWIAWDEQVDVMSYKSFSYDFTYDLLISNNLQSNDKNLVKVSEFDTYFFLPHAYELDSQSCNFPGLSGRGDESFELEKSYSQKKLEYFDEWEKLGIKSQAAFRTHHGKKFMEYFRNRFKSLNFSFTVVDKDSRLSAGLHLTIATIMISILWEIGHEKIRDIEVIRNLKYLAPDAFWLIMNLLMFFGLIRVFYYKGWFQKKSSLKEWGINIGIIIYSIYYFIFIVCNMMFQPAISSMWFDIINRNIFYKYVIIHLVMISFLLFLINKSVFRPIYRFRKNKLFK